MKQHTHKSTNHITTYFSFVAYMHNLQKAGVSQEVAEIHGKALENMAYQSQYLATKEDVLAVKEDVLAVKKDVLAVKEELKESLNKTNRRIDTVETKLEQVQKDIQDVKLEISHTARNTILWMFSIMTVFGCGMLGVMAKGFHWI